MRPIDGDQAREACCREVSPSDGFRACTTHPSRSVLKGPYAYTGGRPNEASSAGGVKSYGVLAQTHTKPQCLAKVGGGAELLIDCEEDRRSGRWRSSCCGRRKCQPG
jgi:hypothetical protein